jgi:hypothetical protein
MLDLGATSAPSPNLRCKEEHPSIEGRGSTVCLRTGKPLLITSLALVSMCVYSRCVLTTLSYLGLASVRLSSIHVVSPSAISFIIQIMPRGFVPKEE